MCLATTQAYLRLGDWRLGFRESCWADWASHLSPTAGGTHITDIYIYSNKWTSILLSQTEEQDESVGAVCKCSVYCYWICVAHYVHKNIYIYSYGVYVCPVSICLLEIHLHPHDFSGPGHMELQQPPLSWAFRSSSLYFLSNKNKSR